MHKKKDREVSTPVLVGLETRLTRYLLKSGSMISVSIIWATSEEEGEKNKEEKEKEEQMMKRMKRE